MVGNLAKTAYTILGGTCRSLDAIVAVSLAVNWYIREATRMFMLAITLQSQPVAWLYVGRHFDSTPVKVRFGNIATRAQKIARFWLKLDGKWKLVRADEYSKYSSRHRPAIGILEMMAQDGFISWMEATSTQSEASVVHHKRFFFGATFVAEANASTQMACLNMVVRVRE